MAPDGRCYGGVNSFGFGGTNAHAVLASVPPPPKRRAAANCAAAHDAGPILWPVSARTDTALQAGLQETHSYLDRLTEDELRSHSVAQARRRSSHSQRLAIVADHRDELLAALRNATPNGKSALNPEQLGRCLFVFSGQGSQWAGMGCDLAAVGPAAADMAERIARLMPDIGNQPILQTLQRSDPAHVDRTDIVQPLLFAQQLMLAAQLESWGIKADAVCGHSVGEIAAACWAGALTL
jgi:acyl transferase domain-containing protein